MKLTIQLLCVLLPAAQAKIMAAKYGACMNSTLHASNPPPGQLQGYHCHFSSRDCVEGEEWMDPMQVEREGIKCSCDDDLNENVYGFACYSMVTHVVGCVAERSDCMEGAYMMGPRYNAHMEVNETCVIGTPSYGAFTGAGCGKQCLCNFGYKSRDDPVEAATTDYGKCYDPSTNLQYCAANMMSCADGEEYLGPHTEGFSGPRCGCDRTHTGACIRDGEVKYCAVEKDSCKQSMSFVNAKTLMGMDNDVDCRMCANTWSEPTVSPAPTDAVTQPPTDSPTISNAPTDPITLSPTESTPAPSAPPVLPTDPPVEPTDPPVKPKPACVDNPDFEFQGKPAKNCEWLADNEGKATLCKRGIMKKNCPITCGRCCEDDPAGFTKGGKTRKCLPFLSTDGKKMKQCKSPEVYGACARSCGRCCYSDRKHRFVSNPSTGKKKGCFFINNEKKVKKFCKDEQLEMCQKECGCTDYSNSDPSPTEPPVLAPTEPPVLPPTEAPVRAPVAADDD